MNPIEQAIFASTETDLGAEYRVVARSAGVRDADAGELMAWEPTRDAMHDAGDAAQSFNFHPLPSGSFCISRSTPAGWERGGGRRVHTHCLIVPLDVMTQVGNNPFAIIQSATQRALWQKPHDIPTSLQPFGLPEDAAAVQQTLLHQLAKDPGPEQMAALVQRACNSVCLALGGATDPATLMAGLFSCLPPECRLEFSFSTGLRFSPWRPYRLVSLSDDPAERLWVATYSNVTVLQLGKGAMTGAVPLDGWAALVERVLATGQISFLASELSKRRADLSLADLPALGLQLLEELDASGIDACEPNADALTRLSQRAHAAHQRFEKSMLAAATAISAAPSVEHTTQTSPEIVEKLEFLDDLVYEAISGKTESLSQLRETWPKLVEEIGDVMLAESREQYLRFALSIWSECAQGGEIRDPTRAIQALDVLCLLFDKSF